MVFELKEKVALITGGASGLGLQFAKQLLRSDLKGVTLADVDEKVGQVALEEIKEEFGENRAIFVKTDVSDIHQFEDAFEQTLEKFKNIDILINNAGILNEREWDKVLAVNVKGVIHGMVLGMDNYLPKYKQGSEAVIVNMSSIAGIRPHNCIPIYTCSKYAIVGLSKSWGDPYHYERSKVRVVTLCPGPTTSNILCNMPNKILGQQYEDCFQTYWAGLHFQNPEHLGKELLKLIEIGKNGSVSVVEDDHPAYEHGTL